MKLLKFVLFIFIFISAFIILSVGLFFTHDATFQRASNFFLAPMSIQISEVEDLHLSLSDYSLSFKSIYIHYEESIAHLQNVNIALGNLSPKRPYHELTIKHLELYLNDTSASEHTSTQMLNLSDYLPAKIIQQYSGFDLWIDTLTINHATYLKRPLIIKNLDIANQEGSLSLGLSPIYKDYQADILLILKTDNQLKVDLRFSEKDFAKLSFSATPNDTQNTISLSSNIEIELNNEFQKFLHEYWVYSDKIHSMQSKINFIGEQTISSQMANFEELYPTLLAGNFKSSVKTNLKFKELPINSLSINFNVKTSQAKNSNKKSIITLHFLENNKVQITPNPKNDFFKGNKSIEFLANKPALLTINSQTQMKLNTDTVNFSKGLDIKWADIKDPAFVHWELNGINGSYQSTEDFKSTINYQFNGRWDKHIASQHIGDIDVNRVNSQFLASTSIHDEDLRSKINFNIAQNNKEITGNYHIQLGKLKSSNKKLNKFIAYWDKDLSLLAGSMDIHGSLNSQLRDTNELPDIHYNFDLKINNIDADYDGFIFSKINALGHFIGKNQNITNKQSFNLKVNTIDAGLEIKNFSIDMLSDMRLDGDSSIQFSNMNASALGGNLSSGVFQVYLPYSDSSTKQKYHSEFQIYLENIQLSSVLALADNPEIEGNGLLYGKLPIFIDEQSTLIRSGWIKNKSKGTLRYNPNVESKAMLKQNPQMALLLSVLGHLNYHKLTSDIDLDDSGLMTIQGHLQGVNPDFKKGYPIVFNPRFELDLQDMITSLQISGNISDKVSNRLQEKHLK